MPVSEFGPLMIGLGSGLLISSMLGAFCEASVWRKRMVRQGLAHYDAQTGNWTWAGPKPLCDVKAK